MARLANESTTDAAEVIMDALYKAEQAAEDAAKASGALQEAIECLLFFADSIAVLGSCTCAEFRSMGCK